MAPFDSLISRFRKDPSRRPEQALVLPAVLQWLLVAAVTGGLAGSASALFLASLDLVTNAREAHPWIIALLPLAGFGIGWIYHVIGRDVEAGNNLILEEIHDPRKVIPLRMAPLILFATLVSHLFGGSVGREGTAVQMGGALADQLSRPLRLTPENRRILLMSGMSAGFASVFGTPLAGAFFGLEVLAIGRLRYDAIFPCLIAAVVGNEVTHAWGIHHSPYSIASIPELTPARLGLALLAGACFGVAGMLFARFTHRVTDFYRTKIAYAPLRPLVGGAVVAALVALTGSTRYIGLGLPVISAAFTQELPPWDFAGKFVMTSLTLGSGLKGGEVTPLFFIGAALGNALSSMLALPASLLAGMGFVAVFAGAANTPFACVLMAMELFGGQAGLYAGVACVSAYLFSGHAGIYHSQRIGSRKAALWRE